MAGIERIISSALPLYPWERGIKGVRARLVPFAILLSLFSFLFSLPGCSNSSFNFEGQWSGKRALANNEKGEDPILNTIAKVDLELKSNGRFTLLEGGIPKEGTYRTEGQKAFL